MLLSLQAKKVAALKWPVALVAMLYGIDFFVCLSSFIATVLMQGVSHEGIYGSIYRFFDVNQEENLPSWFSSIQLFMLATLLAIFTWHNFRKNAIAAWVLCFLSGIFVVFSLDEVSGLHERLGPLTDMLFLGGDRSTSAFKQTGVWTFSIGIPVFALLCFLLWQLKPYLVKTPKVFGKYVAGLIIFMAGAIGVETLINFTEDAGYILFFSIGHIEEFLEMAGISTMIWATADLLYSYNLRISLNRAEALSEEQ